MAWQHTPYTLPLLISAVLSSGVVAHIWQRRRSAGAPALLALMVGVVVWTVGSALQRATTDPAMAFAWSCVQFMGVLAVPTLWFVFALKYTGRDLALQGWWYWLLLVPAITAVVLVTNPYHHFFWSRISSVPYGGYLVTEFEYGTGFWLHAAYSYALLLTGTLILVRALLRSPPGYRPQLGAALLGAGAPWLANAFSIFGLVPFPHLDLTPFAFIVSGVCFGWGLLRYRLLDLIPVARNLVAERMVDGFFILDEQMRILDLNRAAQQVLDLPDRAAMGRPMGDLLPCLAPVIDQLLETEAQDQVAVRRGDSLRHYDIALLPLSSSARRRPGHLLMMHDVTARHQSETHLRQLMEEADSANRAKSRFFAHMNHELRNPLTGIMGHADMLEQGVLGDLSPEQRESVSAIMSASTQLLEMINESLDMARIEAERVTVYVEDFAVADLAQEVVGVIQPLATRQGNELVIAGLDRAGALRADRGKVRQCLLNLLTNAAKFTNEGTIWLQVGRCQRDDGEWLELEVRDTGTGIAEAEQEAIFEPFAQAAQENATRAGGTGLGLAITRSFARLMGGDVTVESRIGQGSVFTLSLPAGAQLDLLSGDRREGGDRRQRIERRTGDERRAGRERRHPGDAADESRS